MVLLQILLATLVGGVLSVMLAATLALTWLPRFADRMLAYAVGILLAFAFTDLLPEAVEQGLDAAMVGQWLLAGIVIFFLLEKAALWRHDHQHALGRHAHAPRATMIVLGDGLHNFVDGVLIAAAFLTDVRLGWLTAVAIAAHEIPQEIGDFIVLLNAGYTRKRAFVYNLLSGLAAVVGGAVGYFALQQSQPLLPYVVVLAAASFIYVALADLVPDLQRSNERGEPLRQFLLLVGGIAVVALLTTRLHQH